MQVRPMQSLRGPRNDPSAERGTAGLLALYVIAEVMPGSFIERLIAAMALS